MRTYEFLNEAISSRVFHYTNLNAALKILLAGEFKLSSAIGSDETKHMPTGYNYFLSTTRTLLGGYHDVVGSSAVMFNLDGNFYNSITKGKAIDYWQDRSKETEYARPSEAEDRIFSKTSVLPIDGVTSIHVYVEPMADKERERWGSQSPALARKLLLAAKIRRIPAFLYEDKKLWKRQAPGGQVTIEPREVLKGPESTRSYISTHPGYLRPWVELMYAKDTSQLSKEANQIQRGLHWDYDRMTIASGLKTSLFNARKPNSGVDYEQVKKIIGFMRKYKLNSVEDFVEFIAQRWKENDSK